MSASEQGLHDQYLDHRSFGQGEYRGRSAQSAWGEVREIRCRRGGRGRVRVGFLAGRTGRARKKETVRIVVMRAGVTRRGLLRRVVRDARRAMAWFRAPSVVILCALLRGKDVDIK
jgi:hypothetical protein